MITPPPTPSPSRSLEQDVFDAAIAAHFGYWPTMVDELNDLEGNVEALAGSAAADAAETTTNAGIATTKAGEAAASAVTAATLAGIATTKAGEAAASAAAASAAGAVAGAAAAGATAWVSGAAYTAGNTVYSLINFLPYRRTVAGTGTIDPSLDGTNWRSLSNGIAAVTTSTTLTSTPTLLQITPTGYGVTVTLPDATTCQLGGPLHAIYNKSGYQVRLVNSVGALVGFVPGNSVSYVALDNNATAAGVWAVSGIAQVGISAELNTANFNAVPVVIDLGTNRELLLGFGASGIYGVVFDRNTGAFGSAVLIRSGTFTATGFTAGLSAANQVLVVSCPSASTAFQAATLSISGSTITVNTAATATLATPPVQGFSATGVLAIGGSFVCSYAKLSGTLYEIRAMTVSGTTVTIGAALGLAEVSWTSNMPAPLFVEGAVLLLAGSQTSSGTTRFYAYTVSGTTITAGTPATYTGTAGQTLTRSMVRLGTGRYAVLHATASGAVVVSVMTLAGTVVTISTTSLFTDGVVSGAVVGNNKVIYLVSGGQAALVTDTAGTASVSLLTPAGGVGAVVQMVAGTTAHTLGASTLTTAALVYTKLDCSGATPAILSQVQLSLGQATYAGFAVDGNELPRLNTSPKLIYGNSAYQGIAPPVPNAGGVCPFLLRVNNGVLGTVLPDDSLGILGHNNPQIYAGRSDSERWACLAHSTTYSGIRKLESVA